jgi:hypothetical protein
MLSIIGTVFKEWTQFGLCSCFVLFVYCTLPHHQGRNVQNKTLVRINEIQISDVSLYNNRFLFVVIDSLSQGSFRFLGVSVLRMTLIGSHGNKWRHNLSSICNKFLNIFIGSHGNKWLHNLSSKCNSFLIIIIGSHGNKWLHNLSSICNKFLNTSIIICSHGNEWLHHLPLVRNKLPSSDAFSFLEEAFLCCDGFCLGLVRWQ